MKSVPSIHTGSLSLARLPHLATATSSVWRLVTCSSPASSRGPPPLPCTGDTRQGEDIQVIMSISADLILLVPAPGGHHQALGSTELHHHQLAAGRHLQQQ